MLVVSVFNMSIKVYVKLKGCPICEALKTFLTNENLWFQTVDIATAYALTELSMNNVFTTMAPVLQIDDNFYKANQFSDGITFQPDKVRQILQDNDITHD